MNSAVPPPNGWGQPGYQAPQAPKKPLWKKKRVIIPVVGLVAIVAISNNSKKSTETTTATAAAAAAPAAAAPAPAAKAAAPAPAAAAPAAAAPAAPAKPAPIAVSSKQLIDTLTANALKAKNTYEGKEVTVSGFVGNIDASGKYFSVDPEPDAFVLTGVQAETGKQFAGQIANFTKNQPVTVTGKISHVGEIMGYSVEVESIK